MINKLLSFSAAALLLISTACSTSKLAQTDTHDDVYYSMAQAKEAAIQQEKKYITERDVYADEDSYSDSYSGYYDDYTTRINRFYRYSPWRGYYDYDPFYSYSPYGFNRFNRPWGVNVYIGTGFGYRPWFDDYYWGYYGYPYRYNHWGLYSYYNAYPYYGGYYGNYGGYYGGWGRDIQSSPNYRPRPSRGFENISAAPGRTSVTDGARPVDTRSRTERYNDGSSTTTSPRTSSGSSTRPASPRPTRTESARPQRSSDESRGTYTRPTRVENNYPSSGSGSSSSGRSSNNNGGSSSTSGGRPTRGN